MKQIVGGGSQNDYLNQATATVTGNVLVQAIAQKRFATLADARRHVAQNVRLKRFAPRPSLAWEEAARRYAAIEARHVSGRK